LDLRTIASITTGGKTGPAMKPGRGDGTDLPPVPAAHRLGGDRIRARAGHGRALPGAVAGAVTALATGAVPMPKLRSADTEADTGRANFFHFLVRSTNARRFLGCSQPQHLATPSRCELLKE
jgi:hypothetical protein